MRSHATSRTCVVVFAVLFAHAALGAQAAKPDSLTSMKADGSLAAAPADTSHRKHGMFGKLKSVAQNKTVQNITKAAVCTAVPGGQYMVGAVDAAKTKGGSASAIASGAAGSQSCIPGIGGPAGGALGAKTGLAGAGIGAAGALGTAGAMGKMGGLGGSRSAAAGGAGAPTAEQIASMQAMSAKGGAAPGPGMPNAQQLAAMQAMSAQLQANGMTAGVTQTEAPGEQLKLSGMPTDEIRKGKLTLRKIDWMRASPSVSASTVQGFTDLLTTVASAMKESGGTYHVDIYMDKHYEDAESATLGQQRAALIVSILADKGQLGAGVVTTGKIGKDKEQRVEIVKSK